MSKSKQGKVFSLALDAKLSDELQILKDLSGKSRIQIVREFVELLVLQAISYEHCTWEILPDRNMVTAIFYGTPKELPQIQDVD